MNFYYAAYSEKDLSAVCHRLELELKLPQFEFDWHDNWEYAFSQRAGMSVNVTKAEDNRTIETWSTGCPSGANYQVILSADFEPSDFLLIVAKVLGAEVVRYASATK